MIKDELTRELKLTELLSLSRDVFIKNIRSIIMICLIVNVPLNIIDFIASQRFRPNELEVEGVVDLKYFFVALLLSLLGVVSNIGVIMITEKFIKNDKQEENWKDLFIKAINLFPKVILMIFVLMLFMIPAMLIVVPAVILGVYCLFIVHVIVLGRAKGVIATVLYSYRLIENRWFKTFGYVLIIYLGVLTLSGVFFQKVGNFADVFIGSVWDIASSFAVVLLTVMFLNRERILQTGNREQS